MHNLQAKANAQQPAEPKHEPSANNSKKKNKNKKNKNRSKADEEMSNGQNDGQTKIVTLRNPLFQSSDPQSMPPTMPMQQQNQASMNINQPASIIKNDNGMFTIRNMALQQALSNGMGQNYMRPYSGDIYQPPADNYSYFSNNSIGTASAIPSNPSEQLQAMESNSTPFYGTKTSNAAIGSEMKKYAQQMKNTTGNAINMIVNENHQDNRRSVILRVSANFSKCESECFGI